MLSLPESYVWDFWLVDDGERHHLFFLYASNALRHPDERHYRASVGHAVSTDLVHWERVQDALVRSDPPAFDDLATWTGSVVRHPDGTWYLFYTGATLTPAGNVQSIGFATSADLMTWDKQGQVLAADPRWYERIDAGLWHDEAFRDPWVFRDGSTWRMLITARADRGPADERGVIGTAVSDDLRTWTLQAPLTEPGAGFGQLEVMETVEIEGRRFLLFNCLAGDLSHAHRATGTTGGVWITPERDGEPRWEPAEARLLTGHDRYVGRITTDRATGRSVFLAFQNVGSDGAFVGGITDPVPIGLDDAGLPVLLEEVPATA